MSAPRRTWIVALVVALLALPGCPALTAGCKLIGLCRPPVLELTESVPSDFELIVHVRDQLDPPADYTLTFRRSGQCEYRVVVRAPQRRESSGPFQILENQVIQLHQELRKAGYAEMEPRYPASGEGKDRALGVQAYSVRGNDLQKEVQTHFHAVPGLEKVRTLALSYLPEKVLTQTGAGAPVAAKVTQVMGDVKTRLFYAPEDPRLKDVPSDRRQPFANWQEALNAEFSPAPGFEPWKRTD